MKSKTAGFSLIEMLIAMTLMSFVMAGVIGSFAAQNRVYVQQDRLVELEENLRMGMELMTDRLRTAGYGVPDANLTQWIPWVTGFTSNPDITSGPPDTLSVAGCFESTLATLTANAAIGDTTLTLNSATELNASTKSLILVNDEDNMQVKSVSGSTITIDTDPTTAGNQGIGRAYMTGTPLCRIDVHTFSLSSGTLVLDENQGAGSLELVDGFTEFVVASLGGNQYRIALTASAEVPQMTGSSLVERRLQSEVLVRN